MEKGGKMITDRGIFIKDIIQQKQYKKYLEIGLSTNPRAPYRLIDNVETKHSVDMSIETGADFIMDSDSFFTNLENGSFPLDADYKWDVIFVDGDHNAEQVYKDLMNAFKHIADNGVIFVHDILPSEYGRTLETSVGGVGLALCDAWKVMHYCLKTKTEMHVCCLEEGDPNPCGLGVIVKNKQKTRKLLQAKENPFFQFSQINNNKRRLMNVIAPEDLLKWISKPFYNHLEQNEPV